MILEFPSVAKKFKFILTSKITCETTFLIHCKTFLRRNNGQFSDQENINVNDSGSGDFNDHINLES